jgi:hypothetical protein
MSGHKNTKTEICVVESICHMNDGKKKFWFLRFNPLTIEDHLNTHGLPKTEDRTFC